MTESPDIDEVKFMLVEAVRRQERGWAASQAVIVDAQIPLITTQQEYRKR